MHGNDDDDAGIIMQAMHSREGKRQNGYCECILYLGTLGSMPGCYIAEAEHGK